MNYHQPQIFHHIDKPFCNKEKQKNSYAYNNNQCEYHSHISSYMLYGGIILFLIYSMRKK